MPPIDAGSIRVTITLEQEIFNKIKKTSRQIGLRPATWISMVVTSKVNQVDVSMQNNGAPNEATLFSREVVEVEEGSK